MDEKAEQKAGGAKRDEALVERLFRRVLDRMGAVVDRKLGREIETQSGFTTSRLIERMNRLIDERVREDPQRGRIAPHHLKLKIEWGTHSEAPPETIKEIENEILAAAIDHINDQRLRTLAPVKIETIVDIFTTGIAVDPTYGEFEEQLKEEDEARRRAAEGITPDVPKAGVKAQTADMSLNVRVTTPDETHEAQLRLVPGGRRLSIGRAHDSDLPLEHQSVSKIHAALLLNREGTLLVSDTGSTNGTYINGRRIAYGEARQIEDGDVVSFGDVEVRFKKAVTSDE
ncbi:MAG TPA: FHA domain-containing protein [Pyrinomonadaceae bacterium]|nr:FHA domain-containing protein [Pyrinomonadaceae bacterium]